MLDPPGNVYVTWLDAVTTDIFFSRGSVTQSSSDGISGSVSPTSATIAVGSSANFAVSLNSTGGSSGPVNLACIGLASGMNCKFNPAQVNLPANGSASSTSR